MIEEGWAALHAGDADAARDRFERALQHAESGAAREGLGQAIYLQRDYTGAIAQQERAYAAYPGNAKPLRLRGQRAILPGLPETFSVTGRCTTDGWPGPARFSKKR